MKIFKHKPKGVRLVVNRIHVVTAHTFYGINISPPIITEEYSSEDLQNLMFASEIECDSSANLVAFTFRNKRYKWPTRTQKERSKQIYSSKVST